MSVSGDRPPGGWVAPIPEGAAWAGNSRGWPIRSSVTSIGRGDDCDIQIRDAKISRLHAELIWDRSALYLAHRSATNETLLMGIPIPRDEPRYLANTSNRLQLADGIELDVQIYAAVTDAATVPNVPVTRLVAVLLADAVGFSRLTEADEIGALRLLEKCHRIFIEQTNRFGGHLVNRPGDSVLLVFDSAVRGLGCAIATQNALQKLNSDYPVTQQMHFRFGMTTGEVAFVKDNISGGELAYGDAINVADRLQRLADPGQIAVSQTVREYVEGRKDFQLELIQEVTPKNMTKTVSVYRVMPGVFTD